MTLLARYVLSEVLQIFLLLVVALTAVLLLCGIGKEALEHGLGAGPIARLIPYVLPKAMLFAVPATILFAVTSVFGRLSASGEIVALKALGISPTKILLPVFALAVLLSVLTFWLNDVAFSWSELGVRYVVLDSFEEIALSVLRTQGSFHSPQFSVIVKRVEGSKLISPTFYFPASGNSPAVTIRAEWAELKSNPGSGVLTLICANGSIEMGGTWLEFSDTIEREIRLMDPNADPHAGVSPSQMPLRIMPERAARQTELIERLEQQQAAHLAYVMASGDYARLVAADTNERAERLQQARWNLYRMRLEPFRRWANGFSCLCFVMVGLPMAILRRYSETWATFFVCFLPILLIYYPLMMFAVDRAKMGALPPVISWLGNCVLALWGLWLLRRVYRY
jgi:lipopolysaccharide export system permease protein